MSPRRKYPKQEGTHGAYARNYPASVREKVDIDYAAKLDAPTKLWLAKVLNEYADAGFKDTPAAPIRKARSVASRCTATLKNTGGEKCPNERFGHRPDAPSEYKLCWIHLCYREKNTANNDAYAVLRSQDRFVADPGDAVEAVKADPKADHSPTPGYLSAAEYKAALRELREAIDDKNDLRIHRAQERLEKARAKP